ncbi:SDR family NAD(P)-dependent oxidoreductase [Myxococcus sp. 1LA]
MAVGGIFKVRPCLEIRSPAYSGAPKDIPTRRADVRPDKRTALVTGARTGVGRALTQRLLAEGWDVAVLVRSPIADTADLIEAERTGRLRAYQADLADFQSLRGVLADLTRKEPSIDVLFNNAGVGPAELTFSPQGREVSFEVNTVAPYVLTLALAGNVANSQLKRVVNTSSNALLHVKSFDPAGLARRRARSASSWGPMRAPSWPCPCGRRRWRVSCPHRASPSSPRARAPRRRR